MLRRTFLVAAWIAFAGTALYLYFFHRSEIQGALSGALSASLLIASLIYVGLGALRAFTLIPSTYLVLAAFPFFPPTLLFVLTILGILISSAIIYLLSGSLHLEEFYEHGRHAAKAAQLRAIVERHELPIIVGWSFFPFAPTDVICYVCGVLEVNFPKFLLGILVGEGTICAVYVLGGDATMRWLQMKP